MVLLKSNLYHLILKQHQSLSKYEIQTTPKLTSISEHQQIIKHLENYEQHLIATQNGFYTKEPWKHKTHFKIMLLKGQEIDTTIIEANDTKNQTEYLDSILNKLMINTKFLVCSILNSCYNPFQWKTTSQGNELPGFRLASYKQSQTALFIIPEILVIQKNIQSLKQDILIDITTGRFYKKSDVIKVDKDLDLIYFRDRSTISKNQLRSVRTKTQTGYELGCALSNYYQRIQITSSELMKHWGISISQKSEEMQVTFVDPGFMTFKGVDKSLNNMIFPVTRAAYNQYYKTNFENQFEEFPILQIYVCFKQFNPKVKALMDAIDKIRARMDLNLTVYKAEDWDVSHFIPRPSALYLILTNDVPFLYKKEVKQSLVASEAVYHIIDYKDISETDSVLNQVTTLQNLSILTSKFRMAPWKLKNIPFCNQPVSVVSVSVEKSNSEYYSIAMTFSINSFISKFASLIQQSDKNKVEETIERMLERCLSKFNQYHKRFPMRIIMFISSSLQLIQTFHKELQLNLSQFYAMNGRGNVEFIEVSFQPSPSLRLFKMGTQLLNPQTVKPTGLLSCLVFQNKLCLQLLMQSQMTEFTVHHQSNDPDFLKKMSELIVKLSFGSVDNTFGGGLGFLGFARKLNRFRDVDLTGWKNMLMEGYMLYL